MNVGFTYGMLAGLLGLSIGFVNSIPLGPITVSIIDTSFRRGFWPAFMIGLGALVMDVFYCAVGVFGVSLFDSTMETIIQSAGFPVLSVLGGRLMYLGFKGQMEKTHLKMTHLDFTKNFSLGFVLCLTNPLAIGFWIVTLSLLFSYEMIRSEFSDKLSFVIGMGIGTSLWFFSLARFVAWRRQTISDQTIRKISIGTGFVLVALGLAVGIRFLVSVW